MWVVASLSPQLRGRRLRKQMPAARVSPSARPSLTSQGSSSPASDSSTTSGSSEASLQQDRSPWPRPTAEDPEDAGGGRGGSSSHETSPCPLTPYQRLLQGLNSDERWQKEVALGRRVGLYRFRGELGSGNFSRVKVAVHCLTKEKVAVKILDKAKLDQKTQRMLSREIGSMECLQHPHVIRLYEVMETISKVYLVMEFAPGGELFHKVTRDGRLPEDQARPLFAQVTSALDHMHKQGIVHRDLKAENVFFSGPRTVKVGDFGFSILVEKLDNSLSTFCGSPPYAAPELFKDEDYQGPYVDLWALGVLLYFMVTGSMPFKAQTVAALKRAILDGQYTAPAYLSDGARTLVCGLLQQNPAARYTLDQIRYSDWMRGQPYPQPLPRYLTWPVPPGEEPPVPQDQETPPDPVREPQEEEREASNKLVELGLTSEMMRDCPESGARSNVTGTYRILLHRLQQTKYGTPDDDDSVDTGTQQQRDFKQDDIKNVKRAPSMPEKNSGKSANKLRNRKSKACVIL